MSKSLPALLVLSLISVLAIACAQPAAQQAAGPPADAVADHELWERATLMFKPLPTAADNPANPVTQVKVDLGRDLYFDTQLSKDGNISCNSCHQLANFGVDSLPVSPGDGGETGNRNSPTVLNAALHVAQFWDGRAVDVEEQAGMPVLNPIEMAIPSEDFVVDRLAAVDEYRAAFAAAFPEDDEPLTYVNVRHALAAFERTLLTPSPFDDYLNGDHDALDEQEKKGLSTFMTLGCTACHNGITVGAHIFRKFGLGDDYWVHTNSAQVDDGRFAVTGQEADRYVFKVASLRNVAETGPYFHDGSVATLEEAIPIMARVQVGAELSAGQVAELAAFLRSLTGELPEEVVAALPIAG